MFSTQRYLRILLACISFLSCTKSQENVSSFNIASQHDPIINGTTVPENESGFVRINIAPSSLCTGVLITNRWILTAQHCVHQDGESTKSVLSPDQFTLTMGTQTTTVIRVFPYASSSVDAALLETDAPFSMNGSATGYYAPLYPNSESALIGQRVNCYGYGRNTYASGSGTLRMASGLSVSSASGGMFTVTPNGSGQIPWKGDSGGTCLAQLPDGTSTITGPQSNCLPDDGTMTVSQCSLVSINSIRSWVQEKMTPYKFEFTKACTSVSGPDGSWDYTCNGEKTTFNVGESVSILTKFSNLQNNHRFKSRFYRNGTFLWEDGTGYNVVDKWGWDKSYYWPKATNPLPGVWDVDIFIDSSDGKGFVPITSKRFFVDGPSYKFSNVDVCTSIGGPDASWNYTCNLPTRTFNEGSTAYVLAKFINLAYDHRFHVNTYKDGVLQWQYTTDWNHVGIWGWDKAYFSPSFTGLTAGSWKADIFIEANDGSGKGEQYITTLTFTVLPSVPYKYAWSDICSSIGGPDASWEYFCNSPRRTFHVGETVYGLAKFTDLKKDHRFKVIVSKNYVYAWEYVSPWNRVGMWGWDKSFFPITMSSAQQGTWTFGIYIEADDGKGMRYVDSRGFDVVP